MNTEEILHIMDRFADREIGNLTLQTEGVSLTLNRTPYDVSAFIPDGAAQPVYGSGESLACAGAAAVGQVSAGVSAAAVGQASAGVSAAAAGQASAGAGAAAAEQAFAGVSAAAVGQASGGDRITAAKQNSAAGSSAENTQNRTAGKKQDEAEKRISNESESGMDADKDVYLTAPVAGVFYHAPAPGEDPYVSVGQTIHKGETVGLLEAMKMISEVPAECDGVVEEILMENEAFASYHAPLLRIRPLEVAANV